VADRDIDALAYKVEHVVARGQTHVDLRMVTRKARQPRPEPHRCQWHCGRHRKRATRPGAAPRGCVDRLDGFIHRAIELSTFVSESERTIDAMKQGRSEPLLQSDVTVAVHSTHDALADRAFDDPEQLGRAIDSLSPRAIGIVACRPGSMRSLMAAAYRLRARPLYLRVHERDEAACAMRGMVAPTVGLRTLPLADEAVVDHYWRSIAP